MLRELRNLPCEMRLQDLDLFSLAKQWLRRVRPALLKDSVSVITVGKHNIKNIRLDV